MFLTTDTYPVVNQSFVDDIKTECRHAASKHLTKNNTSND